MGRFPDSLKRVSVSPIHEADSLYWCLIFLHWLSNLFEKAIATRLTDFAIENFLLSVNQFGFRPEMSNFEAISRLTELIYDSTNRKSHTLCLFLDLKKSL